jgi:hypothetical protein
MALLGLGDFASHTEEWKIGIVDFGGMFRSSEHV